MMMDDKLFLFVRRGFLPLAGFLIWSALTFPASAELVVGQKIIFLGDSITAGYGLDDPSREAYPALIQEKISAAGIKARVANAGVSGDTTAGGLRRVKWVLGNNGVDILVIALGGNDGLRGIDTKQSSSNLKGIIASARALNPGVVILLAGMRMPENMGKDYVEQFAAVFTQIARDERVILIPFLLEGVGGVPEMNQPDLIHPTAQGQVVIASNVWKYLEPVLKKKR